MKGDELTRDNQDLEAPASGRSEPLSPPAEEFITPQAEVEFSVEAQALSTLEELAPVAAETAPDEGEELPYDADGEEAEVEDEEEVVSLDEDPSGSADGAVFEDHDPFATAYDLERGEPIRDRQSKGGLPHRANIRSAREFFSTEILYRHDILLPEDRDGMHGTYRIELKGYRGGVWTVKLSDEISVVNRREDADVVVIMQQRDFLSLVNGDLNPQLALLAKKMRVSGDLKRAVALQALFAPSSD